MQSEQKIQSNSTAEKTIGSNASQESYNMWNVYPKPIYANVTSKGWEIHFDIQKPRIETDINTTKYIFEHNKRALCIVEITINPFRFIWLAAV